ncbi:MAG: type II toxin-antitoxin system VapC family toxin [Gemmatimonadales bacterium]|nr:type II toxin-antitoxin system VapC family toxin [Candidatus Palauibacter rhopaloidicola]MXX68822.1 type II toxin-antitoxin system VapC family toxin [Gemmatimonadales bacterium]MYG19417.1 type II toxin-antitoxin system VapC family toxin [Gemmatimonadales bacterium]MYH09517.1 type II toxin-antitoxin system VapC family toxin [Gemmatimonadales bacterium]MYL07261.1 type II toxin-antitoxin system VapC family toxin [Gemmatimonadales bacterium]
MNSSWNGEPKPPVNEAFETVLDASAVLAALLKEPGAVRVERALRRGAAMSSVNVAEVAARLSQDGWSSGDVSSVVTGMGIEVIPFDRQAALLSGAYRTVTRRRGLGLGDRACLATASSLGLPVLTADRSWADVSIPGATVVLIR